MKRLFPPSFVFLTPLARINGYRVKKYCGLVVLHFIREGSTALEETAINNYSHKFLLEVIAVTKAHVKCIGGCRFTYCRRRPPRRTCPKPTR